MSDIELRRVTGEALPEAFYELTAYAFEASPPLPDRSEFIDLLTGLSNSVGYAAYQDELIVGTAAAGLFTINVRDALYPLAGIWAVATHPNARRMGVARRVMTKLLADRREDGDPFTCLYAFRESFYERLGYAIWPHGLTYRFPTRVLAPTLKMDLDGSVSMISRREGADLYRAFLLRTQAATHGMAASDEQSFAYFSQQNNNWLAVARDSAGEVIGVMTYKIAEADGDMEVWRFYADNVTARYLLLNWAARHIDQVKEVTITVPHDMHLNTWLPDLDPSIKDAEPPLGRVLDVAKIGGMTVGEGAFRAQIVDPTCPWNEGMWRFTSADGVLVVEPADHADCTLTISGLSALVFGTHDPAMFAIRGWGDPSMVDQAAMRALFPPRVPWHHMVY